MLLSDSDMMVEIGNTSIGLEPYDAEAMQAASYDVHLGDTIRRMGNATVYAYEVSDRIPVKAYSESTVDGVILKPGDFVLASTIETISLNDEYAARFEGKSSLGRIGLATHITAGFIDPGFSGTITLEIKNESNMSIAIKQGMPIGQLCFYQLRSPARHPYGSTSKSHYQNQNGVMESWLAK